MKKRLLSLCLAFVMVLAMLPVTALAATELTVSTGTVDIVDAAIGPYTVTALAVYKQSTYENLSIKSAEQDGNTINVVLADDTDPSTAVQVGFSGTGSGLTLNHTGNKGTLSDGELTLTVGVTAFGGGMPQGPTVTYTIKFTVGGDTTPAVKFTDDLDTTEVTCTQGKVAETLSVKAEYTEDTSATINYQWYSYTESVDNATAIDGATDASYTPSTETVGTTYYYVVASCGDLTATSKIAKIKVVEPVVRFTKDLNTAEETYTQGKPASALNVAAEYTGVTDSAVAYQWYSYTDSVDNAVAVEGATEASYTPATETLGTICYYVVASCEGLTATSSTAKITVVAPVVEFTTDLSTAEVTYTQGKPASALTVAAEYTGVTDSAVTYQWYSYTDSADNAEIIDGATGASYTPLTQTVGTTYYYVVASCEGLTAVSAVAKIKVVEPVVRFTTNLSDTEVIVYQGKPASALTVAAEYTGVTESAVTYQWYSNTTNSTDGGAAIEDETGTSYTPVSDTLGTTYYYVVASCGGLTAASNIAKVTIAEEPTLNVTDNVIDITDKTVYSWSRYYAKATNIKIIGADVEKATEDGTTVNIVLSGTTNPSQEISVEFGTSLNRCTMSGHTGSATLSEGKAQLSMTLTGTYVSSLKGSVTYTLNFSLGAPPSEVPTRLVETDSAETYAGVAVEFDLSEYFTNASVYYLVEDQTQTPLEGSSYAFKTFTGGNHTLVFAAANAAGTCVDYVTVTVAVTEIKSGAWLGITTSNGSVNYVLFKDAEGNEIDDLTASLEGTAINVSVPRSYAADGKITAAFNLTQNGGLPFITTKNGASGTTSDRAVNNKFTEKTITLSSGKAVFTFYLYNVNPSATNNPYTPYTINYAIANEAPVLAEGREAAGTASITADQSYTIDLDGIFVDPDDGDVITGWKVSVNGAAAVAAEVDENNVYSWQTNDAGVYTLTFYGLDNYNAASTETYTVTLTVSNAATTYDVTVNVPEGIAPTFYYTANAQSGTELTADAGDNVYTVKVPTNVSVISWRADGAGMSAAVSEQNNSLTLVKPVFKVMAEETEDTGAAITVTHANNLVGSENNYLLLAGIGGYTITATPSADYSSNWNEGKLTNYTVSGSEIEIPLVSKGVVFTFPYFAELTVSEASRVQGIAPKKVEAYKTTGPDYASGTCTATYILTSGKVYEYRVSVPADNVNRDQYVTYVATFTKKDAAAITVTKEQLESGENGRTTQDRDLNSNRGRNVADIYSNVNAKGYRNLSVGQEFQLITTRQYWGINADWLLNSNYYYVEPEFHYSVVGLDGVSSTDVIEIDANGKITAKAEGTAIVLATYDAMTLNHESALSAGALGDYPSTPNDFYGAIWPENTGVYVISVGAADSGITTGMTINEDKTTSQKAGGKALDAELDVIYFIGEKGEYTFKPGTEDVTVFVANPTVSETAMSFTGFVEVDANDDGVVTVPLTAGRNIVKLEKDGKATYQVITAKSVTVTINGEPLETAAVAPGQKVKVEFNKLFAPVNRMAIYNTASCVVYSEVSGWDGKLAGNARGSYGEYGFAAYAPKHIVEHFVNASTDNSGYSNSQVTTTAELTVPEDFTDEYFTLSGGSFNIGGFMPYLLGSHYEKLGVTPPANTNNENVNCYLGQLPDISIPVATPTSIAVTTQPTKTEYNIGDVFDPAGMVVTASYGNSGVTRPVTGYTYDTTAFTEAGEKQIAITYGQLTTTVTVTVTNITLEKIEATTAPTKTLYYIGERFDPTGMVITATYSDNSTREITDYTYAPGVIAKDTTAITVTYGSKSVDVPVTVSLVERLEITAQPTKKNYTEGERFDPAGMVVKAFYTDGSSFETDKYDWSPAGQLTPSDTTITITYNGSEGAASLQPVTVNITVEALQSGGGDGDSGNTPPSYESITVYMTFVNRGSIVVQDTPVVVYDEDRDGTYRIGDAFRALHRDYYPGGESGYAEISGNGVSGWVSKFWGSGDSTFTYARNHRWASSTNNSIYSGDSIAAINGVDSDFFSDLYTWFDSSSYSALTEQNETFTVNGLNLMGSSASYNALHAPAGATVSVYKSGSEISSMRTTVGADGSFTLYFTEAGTYTLKISGTAEWGSYTDAPVAPCTCSVYVRKNPTPEEKPEEKPNETPADTVTPEIEADANGEAKVEIGTDAVTDALKQAADENKQSVVVAPVVKGESNTVTVELPKDAVDQIAKESDLPLTVETPAASVTIPSAALNELAAQSGSTVAISAETVKDESGQATGEVKINITVDSEKLENVGGIAVNIPTEEVSAGSVLVVVHSDGTETVVKKSAAGENGVAALLDGSATVKIVDNSKEFVDVDSESWYADGVDFVSSRELYKGVGNDQFDPTGDMTRGMLVTVLHRLEDEMEHNYGGSFHDVEEDNWYTDAIHWAADHGLVNGYGNGYFGANDEMTREQMITMTFRYLKWLGLDTSARGELNTFTDSEKISDWAKEAMEWGVGVGIIEGTGNSLMDPEGNATRAQVAVFMQRVIGQMTK